MYVQTGKVTLIRTMKAERVYSFIAPYKLAYFARDDKTLFIEYIIM